MSPTLDALPAPGPSIPGSWRAAPVRAAVYLRGWRCCAAATPSAGTCGPTRRRVPRRAGGIFLALASPIEPFAALLLAGPHGAAPAAHDGGAAASLAGVAAVPLLRGLPQPMARLLGRPLLRLAASAPDRECLTHPLTACSSSSPPPGSGTSRRL